MRRGLRRAPAADGDVLAAVRELRARGVPGEGRGLLVMGSASLAAQLTRHDLVDEYRLMIEPILLGGGKQILGGHDDARALELISATVAATGVIIATYRPVRG